jgi:hypothetical protein
MLEFHNFDPAGGPAPIRPKPPRRHPSAHAYSPQGDLEPSSGTFLSYVCLSVTRYAETR